MTASFSNFKKYLYKTTGIEKFQMSSHVQKKLAFYLDNVSIYIPEMFDFFTQHHGSVSSFIKQHGPLLLRHACFQHHIPMIEYLLEKGVDCLESNKETALLACPAIIALPNLEIVKILFEHGAYDPKNLKDHGIIDVPFLKAIEAGHVQTIEFLLTKGQDIDVRHPVDWTNGLVMALLNKNNTVAKLLIDKGINTHCGDKYANYPLSTCIRNLNHEMADYILDKASGHFENYQREIHRNFWTFKDKQIHYGRQVMERLKVLKNMDNLENLLPEHSSIEKKMKI